MTDATNDIKTATETAVEEMTTAPKKKAKRPAKKAQAKPQAKAEAKEKPAKPEPVTHKGYVLADDADPQAVAALENDVAESLEAIHRKDADLLGHYLALGEFQARASKMFKSTKLYGEFLKKELPASQSIDAALRSNCKWLYEALNDADHDASDLLTVFGVNDIASYRSGNPTVIRRDYKKAKDEAAKKERLAAIAEENGVDEERAVELEKEAEKKAHDKEQASRKRKLTSLGKSVKAFLDQQKEKEEATSEAADLIKGLLAQDPKDQVAWLESMVR